MYDMDNKMVESDTRISIANINKQMRAQDLREEFSKFGEIVLARVNLDRKTKESKGFGCVEFANKEDAQNAIYAMHQQELWGKSIFVCKAMEGAFKLDAIEIDGDNILLNCDLKQEIKNDNIIKITNNLPYIIWSLHLKPKRYIPAYSQNI
jgi:RNA recognition motif-containing protein